MNGKIKKILNIAGILFAVFCIGCTFSLSCSAVGHKGSLELQCKFSEEDEEIILDGDEYIVTKIADFDKNQFSILPQYKNFDCNWNLIISSEYHEKAFEALIAEEARQIEEAKRAAAEGWADREDSL